MGLNKIRTKRDILILSRGQMLLVFAVDSAGGIGSKPLDKIKVSGEILGKLTAQTSIMEVLAVGARPIALAYSLCVEPYPTGEDVLRGIKKVAREAGLDPRKALIGSSEKNVVVDQSGLGVCAIGLARNGALRIGRSRKGDIVISVGQPFVGNEVMDAEVKGLTADIATLKELLRKHSVREVVPAGSKGVSYEAKVIAEDSGLKFRPYEDVSIDSEKSAGPATALVASVQPRNISKLSELKRPVVKIGYLCEC